MKTIQEQINVMQHYANGGKFEACRLGSHNWSEVTMEDYLFDFREYRYRIKEQKKTIIIEKWLCEYTNCELLEGSKRFFILEKATPFEFGNGKKVKLLESKEIEL